MTIEVKLVAKMLHINLKEAYKYFYPHESTNHFGISTKRVYISKVLRYLIDHPEDKKKIEDYKPSNLNEEFYQNLLLCRSPL